MEEACQDAIAVKNSARLMVLKALAQSWESTTVLAESERRAALMVWPMLSGMMQRQTMASSHSRASQLAMGLVPSLFALLKVLLLCCSREPPLRES
jgi:hypothetical protein